MKIWLDDEREAPEGWNRCKNQWEVITLLNFYVCEKDNETITHISLDHDLGEPVNGSGYGVICWIEEQVFCYGWKPPIITTHSQNAVGRKNIQVVIDRINAHLSA
jgi:hypothetical protein